MMGTSGKSEEIIILSDDEDDKDTSCLIVEVEAVKKTGGVLPVSPQDEDLVVTFSRRPDVLPHARYDCPIHPFMPTDCERTAPMANNQLICDQCFCYVCDKLASLCGMWCCSGACHCNSHNKSDFWKSVRNTALLGELQRFNLTLSEVDHHLRNADTMLQSFRDELSALFSSITLNQAKLPDYKMDQQNLSSRYRPVLECVTLFLNKAEKKNSRAAAILHLGAAEEFMRHFQVLGFMGSSSAATISETIIILLHRVISSVQRRIVMGDITPLFMQKLQTFYQNRICFPADMRPLKDSLTIRHWQDVLLVSVLKGQNVSGFRKDKGKKDVLLETISVVLLRTELLQLQSRYRELCRYLRVVLTDNTTLYRHLQDLIPFFKCKLGEFGSALESLFPPASPPASRFTPAIFLLYLRIFETATTPRLTVSQPEHLCFAGASWEPINDAVPLKRSELVKFALKAQRCSSSVYSDSRCWTSLLKVVCSPHGSPTGLPVPSQQFLHESRDAIIDQLNQQGYNIQISRCFLRTYPDQALLLLVTGALGVRILQGSFSPALPVLHAYKDNLWAFQWLCDGMTSSKDRLKSFLKEIAQESSNTPGNQLVVDIKPFQVKFPSEVQL
ncbi:uncharacterized protein LOC102220719 [Xiphophorus maculatus]|uniref:Uncharacterized LOC102220719 n=1 Tax=Xiphophorus maculatus TaxID=8083 RepID=A0A3B5QU91_XIPMA|nr:uncharacterized protein LOC102220719 [Xiphophorus maculatus]